MELTKDIKFSQEEILKNTTITLKYSGKLAQDNSDSIFIVYGFNPSWDNTTEKEMICCDNGYSVDIELGDNDSLNFCFKNSNNEWDNNENNNYIVQIKTENTALAITNNNSLSIHNKLRKSYLFKKKLRLAIYKLITSLPRFITGNYRRRINL